MKCIIIDDEPLAREGMVDMVSSHNDLKLLGAFKNISQAKLFLNSNTVDLIFLDIEMPGINGLEFAKTIEDSMVIFATAYKEYAIDSYAVDAIGYLLKPILRSQFEKAVDKAFTFHKLIEEGGSKRNEMSTDFLFIKSERRYYKIQYEKILFIEGLKDYVVVHTANDKVITALNLKAIHEKLPKKHFLRVSKSYIVNESAIDSFDHYTIYIREHEIPLSKVYQEDFYNSYISKS